jgi:hypothetical protein
MLGLLVVRMATAIRWHGMDPPRDRPEFPVVNRPAGVEPLRPELSGLALRPPPSVTSTVTAPVYRWQPSPEYRRRRHELRAANLTLRSQRSELPLLPPLLTYGEERDAMVPLRRQPLLARAQADPERDLRDLETEARLHLARAGRQAAVAGARP